MQAQGAGSIVNISSTTVTKRGRRIRLRCQQARRRRHDEVRCARGRALRRGVTPCSRSDRASMLNASPEPRERRRLARQSRLGAWPSRKRWLAPSCSLLPTRPHFVTGQVSRRRRQDAANSDQGDEHGCPSEKDPDQSRSEEDMNGRQIPYLDGAGPADVQAVYDKMKESGAACEHLQAYGAPRPLRGAGRRVLRDPAARAPSTSSCASSLREGLTGSMVEL